MSITKPFNRYSLLLIALSLATLNTPSYAAPGTLSNVPLFLTNRAEANIFFMVDDSGSMDGEMMTPARDGNWGGVYNDGQTRIYVFGDSPDTENNYGDEMIAPWGVNFLRSHSWNKMYYNPRKTYEPWTNHPNITNEHAVPVHPNSTTNVDIAPLTTSGYWQIDGGTPYYPATYFVWVDANSNSTVETTDTYFPIQITPTTPVCSNGLTATVTEQTTGAGCMLRTYTNEIRNFANWFTYHRRRATAGIHALSKTIGNETTVGVRMGMATINDDNSAEIQLASMNKDAITGNKLALLNALYNTDSNGSTPLRRALNRTGNYFECTSPNPFGGSACAIQKSAISPATQAPGICQQNFAVLLTDGEYNDGVTVADHDNDSTTFSGTYYPNNVATTQTFQFDVQPYRNAATDTLADLAMHYYERDLDTSLDNRVPIQCGIDENPAQHMVTYALSFGMPSSITPPAHPRRGYAPNCTATTGTAFTWNDATPINDLVHATFNGRGQFYDADNPDALAAGLNSVLRNISGRNGAATTLTFNTSVLSSSSLAYFARFNSGDWSGELSAYPLNPLTGAVNLTTATWDAHTLLDARNLSNPTTDRVIVTYNPGNSALGTPVRSGIPFRWDLSRLSAVQRDDLRTDSTGALETAPATYPIAQARLSFIRGDRACETASTLTCSLTSKPFRDRTSRLGDLIHSAPAFVSKPNGNFPNAAPFNVTGKTYDDFKNGVSTASIAFSSSLNATNRTSMIYIGGNDGKLHAFNATTGQEEWAFIPHSLFATGQTSGLHKLTEPGYTHVYYTDLTPTINDTFVDLSGGSTPNWHTILVGGTRAGSRGIYAIDVTDPDHIISAGSATIKETNIASKVLWEFTSNDDADLGFTFSKPAIVTLGDTTSSNSYVVVGNGYNGSGTGTSILFILKTSGPGSDGVWNLGTDYYKVDTGVGIASDPNGLSTPALIDNNGDGIADRAYAGDLYGRMWAFDLSGSTPSNWGIAYTSGVTKLPLFTAVNGSGTRQPITVKPSVARHPTQPTVNAGVGANVPNVMVFFGTGQYIANGDTTITEQQTFYGVWDKGVGNLTVNRTSPSVSHVTQQSITTGVLAGVNIRVIPDTTPVDYTTKHGWFIDLTTSAASSERSVFEPIVIGSAVFFNTTIPSIEPCVAGGTGWLMRVTAANGQSFTTPVVDINNDGLFNSSDLYNLSGTNYAPAGTQVSGGMPNQSSLIVVGSGATGAGGCPPGTIRWSQSTSDTNATLLNQGVCIPSNAPPGRYSWRQLRFD